MAAAHSLFNLAILGRLELVRAQFGSVPVPPAIVEKFHLAEGRSGSAALRRAIKKGWIIEKEPSDGPLACTLRQDLSRGEPEAIALAVEKVAGLILLDEREGRRRARNVGLEMNGISGSLAQANRQGDLGSLSNALEPTLRTVSRRRPGSGSALRFGNRSLAGPSIDEIE